MKEYKIELCGVERTLPFIPINDTTAFASFVVLGDTELVSACAPELVKRIGQVDAVVTAEAKGIALAYEISRLLGLKEFIVARKSTKTYMKNVVSTGESLHALEVLMDNAGASVVKKAAILAEGDAASRDDIIFLQKLPLFRKTAEGEYEIL